MSIFDRAINVKLYWTMAAPYTYTHTLTYAPNARVNRSKCCVYVVYGHLFLAPLIPLSILFVIWKYIVYCVLPFSQHSEHRFIRVFLAFSSVCVFFLFLFRFHCLVFLVFVENREKKTHTQNIEKRTTQIRLFRNSQWSCCCFGVVDFFCFFFLWSGRQ